MLDDIALRGLDQRAYLQRLRRLVGRGLVGMQEVDYSEVNFGAAVADHQRRQAEARALRLLGGGRKGAVHESGITASFSEQGPQPADGAASFAGAGASDNEEEPLRRVSEFFSDSVGRMRRATAALSKGAE